MNCNYLERPSVIHVHLTSIYQEDFNMKEAANSFLFIPVYLYELQW
jgi:hypothetical protein